MPYRLLRPLLYLVPAEPAHGFIVGLLRLMQRVPGLQALVGWTCAPPKSTRVEAFGLQFPSPIGLAAGFDKDAMVYPALSALGFGFVEVGTLTGEGQSGNPRPRLFRLKADRALVNRMGFNNHGAESAALRFAREPSRRKSSGRRAPVGINIGKTKLVSAEHAVADYEKSARLLGPYADYLVVNVSSPNTPGLRDLQAAHALRPILVAVRDALDLSVANRRVRLLVKIAPDLSTQELLAVADLALELGIDGIVATNTTTARGGLASAAAEVAACGAGGLSGAPLKERSLEVLRTLRQHVGDRLVLISAGGIETADDVWQRLIAGARLVQVYSALVYEGPGLPTALAHGLARKLREEAFPSVEAAIGSASRT